jgi:hypothetical protein
VVSVRFSLSIGGLVAALSVGAASAAPAATEADWAGPDFQAPPEPANPASGVTLADLLTLRNIGALSRSPDGMWLAFPVYQGEAAENLYRVRWFLQPADGSGAPVALAQDGGQPIQYSKRGLPYGYISPEPAKWSPDSRSFAFRRQDGGRIELWVTQVDTGASRRIVDGATQVMFFAWSASGAVLFRTGLDAQGFADALKMERRHGWLWDGRVYIGSGAATPRPPECATTPAAAGCDVRDFAADLDGRVRPATSTETAELDRVQKYPFNGPTPPEARRDGAVVSAANPDAARFPGLLPVDRVMTTVKGRELCPDVACESQFIRQVGWARNGRSVWFLKGESSLGRPDGDPWDETGLYEWDLATNKTRTVYRGAPTLSDCHVDNASAICIREDATEPGRIVRIDLDTGAQQILADANPAFSRRRSPRVSEQILKDPDGNLGFVRLVYPNGYQPGRRYPLVITQYRSHGFLRGGTGDEYPILPLADAGFFVLDISEPNAWDRMKTMPDDAYETWRLQGLRERHDVFAAYGAAVDGLIARGLVDPGRIAITGLSAGAESVHYALQHSTRFAAAIASSGNFDASWIAGMPAAERSRAEALFDNHGVVAAPGSATAQLAWSGIPESLTTPLLINVGQDEVMFGFEGIAALQDAGRPIEVRIFPDQGLHLKVDPQSRAGVYENNVMWLRFWLQGVEDPDPDLHAQYARWEKMRAELNVNHPDAGLH